MAVIGPESTGAVRLERPGSDPGVRALTFKLFREIQKQADRGRQPPDFLRVLQGWQQAQAAEGLAQWLPDDATLSLERIAGEEVPHIVLAVNFRRFVRPARLMVEKLASQDPGVARLRHGAHEIIRFKQGVSLCFAGGTVLVSDRIELLRAVLDRLDGSLKQTTPLRSAVGGLAGSWDLYGVMERAGEAQFVALALLDTPTGEPAPDEATMLVFQALEKARFGVDVVSASELKGFLALTYADAEAAGQAEGGLKRRLEALAERAAEIGMRLEHRTSLMGAELRTEVELAGLDTLVEYWVSRSTRAERGRESEDSPGHGAGPGSE